MGRPKDRFCWDYVDRLPDGKLSCKFCGKEFKGGASRIRRHLSGEGGDIGPCEEVTPDIREDALKESAMKRRRNMLLGEDNDGVRAGFVERGEVPSYSSHVVSANNSLNVIAPYQFSSDPWLSVVNATEGGEILNDDAPNIAMTSSNDSFDVALAALLQESPPSSFNDVCMFERREVGNSLPKQAIAYTGRATTIQASSSSHFKDSSGSNKGREEDVADELVKFVMSNNVSVDVIKGLLTKVAKPDLPPCLLQDDSTIIEKSLWNFEHDVNQHMQMVKESWKTTGCTLMVYDLNEGKGEFSSFDKTKVVLGFYCPKGFIFVDINVPPNSCGVMIKAMKDHVLNLSMENVIKHIYHDPGMSTCHYQACQSILPFHGYIDVFDLVDEEMHDLCLRYKIQKFCSKLCQNSDMVQDLVKKSNQVYNFLVQSTCMHGRLVYTTLENKRVEPVVDGEHPNSFSRLRSIMELKSELRSLRHDENKCFKFGSDVTKIIKDKSFWSDGEELLEALTPLFQISDLVDTFVPTAGYLYAAMDKAKSVLRTYCDRNVSKYQTIWECLENWIKESTHFARLETSIFLSPTFVLSGAQGNLALSDAVKSDLQSIVEGEEKDLLVAELKAYTIKARTPFANIPKFECQTVHPVKLWLKYGGEFPLLQKCAIKLLNQPLSCMCNLVKKHVSRIQGSDNYILRLNYTMMQEFPMLEDRLYKPIPF